MIGLFSLFKAILFHRANSLFKNFPCTPELIRAFISNCFSAFFSSPVTFSEIEKDFIFEESANSTGCKKIKVGAVADTGRHFKNPSLLAHLLTSSVLLLVVCGILP